MLGSPDRLAVGSPRSPCSRAAKADTRTRTGPFLFNAAPRGALPLHKYMDPEWLAAEGDKMQRFNAASSAVEHASVDRVAAWLQQIERPIDELLAPVAEPYAQIDAEAGLPLDLRSSPHALAPASVDPDTQANAADLDEGDPALPMIASARRRRSDTPAPDRSDSPSGSARSDPADEVSGLAEPGRPLAEAVRSRADTVLEATDAEHPPGAAPSVPPPLEARPAAFLLKLDAEYRRRLERNAARQGQGSKLDPAASSPRAVAGRFSIAADNANASNSTRTSGHRAQWLPRITGVPAKSRAVETEQTVATLASPNPGTASIAYVSSVHFTEFASSSSPQAPHGGQRRNPQSARAVTRTIIEPRPLETPRRHEAPTTPRARPAPGGSTGANITATPRLKAPRGPT